MQDERFIELIEAVEGLGGEQLPDTCEPDYYEIEVTKANGKTKTQLVDTTGCHQESLFSIPYDRLDLARTRERPSVDDTGKHVRGEMIYEGIEIVEGVGFAQEVGPPTEGEVIVCADDDRVDLWPRVATGMPS